MAKLAVLFLAALAFQASTAIPRFYEEGPLFTYLEEIKTEVRDLTLFFEKDFPEHHLAIKTVTWQCHKLIEVFEVIISKLREETFVVRGEHKVFKDVIVTLEELVNILRQVTVYEDISKIHELRKYFILTLHTVLEHFERLVTLTNTYYPEFRYTLKYILVEFMSALHSIRSHFVHIQSGFEVVNTPKHLIKEIHEYTREFTEIFKEFTHPTQVKVALRAYLYYVNEIVHTLQDERILGHKELDVVIHRLTNKLREIVFPLMEIMHETTFDMKVFRTKIITDFYEIVSIFEQLVQLCEDKVLPEELTHFLVKIIYHYFYAVKHVSYEIKFGYKIGFYMPEYYNTEYYSKYGYGLYEKDFHHRFFTPYHYESSMYPRYSKSFNYGPFTPYHYESSMYPRYSKSFNYDMYKPYHFENSMYPRYMKNFNYDMYTPYHYESTMMYPRYMKSFNHDMYTPYKYESLFPVHKYNSEFYHGKTFGLTYPTKYYKSMKYDYDFESPKMVVSTIEMLVKRISEQFKYNTFEVKDVTPMMIYNIREFVEFLDYFLEKFETKLHLEPFYNDKLFEQFIYKLKEIKMELLEIVKTGVFTNIHEIRMRFVRYVEFVAYDLCKWFEKYGFEHVFFKDVYYRFVTFLHKVTYERYTFNHEYLPVKDFYHTEKFMPTHYPWYKY
ncbi:hypothetical protein RN001_011246 [Aquatica leii]|uniref:Uncharacterized protein n=1 Tax=Aquatica leii TaxID=1421715 RepID=A0AAN7P222_9COLE|nr:hypothetical protein RN001_011246 [Aquatica leii]